jgi:N-acetylmuramoyl-L-alanine amidase CwlD
VTPTRIHLAAAIAALLALPLPARAAAYVRLSEIAERYGLTADVDLITGRHTLTDGTNRLVLLPGGYQILVNGRFVPVPDRIGADGGDLILPATALPGIEAGLVKRAPAPLAVPAVARAPATSVPASVGADAGSKAQAARFAGTIVVDPGHGGVHTGAHGRAGQVEKEINLGVARIVKSLLEAHGWRVIMTRTDDRQLNPEVNADLDARCAIANRSGADLFVSIHTNYAENTTAQGFEVYCSAGRGPDAALARSINASLHQTIEDEDRGVKTAGFRVIKRTTIPAVLVEVGFVSHPATERRLGTEEYRRKLAEAIVRGIDRYAGRGGSGRTR